MKIIESTNANRFQFNCNQCLIINTALKATPLPISSYPGQFSPSFSEELFCNKWICFIEIEKTQRRAPKFNQINQNQWMRLRLLLCVPVRIMIPLSKEVKCYVINMWVLELAFPSVTFIKFPLESWGFSVLDGDDFKDILIVHVWRLYMWWSYLSQLELRWLPLSRFALQLSTSEKLRETSSIYRYRRKGEASNFLWKLLPLFHSRWAEVSLPLLNSTLQSERSFNKLNFPLNLISFTIDMEAVFLFFALLLLLYVKYQS